MTSSGAARKIPALVDGYGPPIYVTAAVLADLFGWSRKRMRGWIVRKEIPFTRVGRDWQIRVRALREVAADEYYDLLDRWAAAERRKQHHGS